SDAKRRFAEGFSGRVYARLRGLVAEVDCGEQSARDQFAIGKHAKLGTLLVRRRAGHVVYKTPMWLDAQRQPERRVSTIEEPISRVERYRLQCPLATIIDRAHPRDVVIGNGRHGGETEPIREAVFRLQRRRDVVVGAAEPAETAGRIGLQFLFSL